MLITSPMARYLAAATAALDTDRRNALIDPETASFCTYCGREIEGAETAEDHVAFLPDGGSWVVLIDCDDHLRINPAEIGLPELADGWEERELADDPDDLPSYRDLA